MALCWQRTVTAQLTINMPRFGRWGYALTQQTQPCTLFGQRSGYLSRVSGAWKLFVARVYVALFMKTKRAVFSRFYCRLAIALTNVVVYRSV